MENFEKSIFCFFLAIGFYSCGGGPSHQELGVESTSTPYIQQDVICCADYDDTDKICRSYSIPQPKSFTVTLTNKGGIVEGIKEPIQIRYCKAEFFPKNGAPEIEDGYKYVFCTPTTINPGESKDVQVSLESSLVELLNNYYLDFGRALSYRVKIIFHAEGYSSGSYDIPVYVDIDFSNFIEGNNDECTLGG